MKNNKDNIDHFNVLRKIQNNPDASQRILAKELGFSLGKLNYCLFALKAKGLVKVNNFKKNKNKLNYIYILTPKGIVQKSNLTIKFMQQKMKTLLIVKIKKCCLSDIKETGLVKRTVKCA